MPFRSLRSRIFVCTGLVAIGSILGALVGIGELIDEFAMQSVSERLEEARTSFLRYMRGRYEVLENTVASATETDGVRRVVALGPVDRTGGASAAEDARRVVRADFVVLTDETGRVLVDTLRPDLLGTVVDPASGVVRAIDGGYASGLWQRADRLFLVAAAPLLIDGRVRGALAAGKAFDSALAEQIHEVTGTEVVVLFEDLPIARSRNLAGTVDLARQVARLQRLRQTGAPGPHRVTVGDMDSFVTTQALGRQTHLILAHSVDDLMTLHGRLWAWVVSWGILSAGLAMGLSHWIARRLARPIDDLVEASGQIASGNLRVKVETRGAEEIGRLGAAFNHMAQRVEQLVADVRAQADALAEQRLELAWQNKARSDFLATASHELRTPITSIRSFSEILLGCDDDDPDTRREFLDIILAESDRLCRLVEQLVDMASIEGGMMEWKVQDVDLGELVAIVVDALTFLQNSASIVVRFDRPDGPVPYRGDRRRLQQVVHNLVANALKFSPPGTEIVVALRAVDGGLELAVADRGPGVPDPEQRARIFQPFVQGGDILTAKPEGTGLGLPICREIVDAHGGSLHYEDNPGGGARFVVFLPAIDPARERPVDRSGTLAGSGRCAGSRRG